VTVDGVKHPHDVVIKICQVSDYRQPDEDAESWQFSSPEEARLAIDDEVRLYTTSLRELQNDLVPALLGNGKENSKSARMSWNMMF
jgi:hypothetical protein